MDGPLAVLRSLSLYLPTSFLSSASPSLSLLHTQFPHVLFHPIIFPIPFYPHVEEDEISPESSKLQQPSPLTSPNLVIDSSGRRDANQLFSGLSSMRLASFREKNARSLIGSPYLFFSTMDLKLDGLVIQGL
jgi:hypothetical protein